MGQAGAAKVEVATQTTGDATLTGNPATVAPNVTNPPIAAGRRLRAIAGYSVADIFDVEYQAPLGVRGRVQVLGAPFKSAKGGNFSLAASLGLHLSYNQDPDYLESGPKVLSLNETILDVALITGYRIADPVLVYGSIFWVNDSFDGTWQSTNTYQGSAKEMGFNLGFEFAFKSAQIRLEYATAKPTVENSSENTGGIGASLGLLF